jgi:hypothetical protein
METCFLSPLHASSPQQTAGHVTPMCDLGRIDCAYSSTYISLIVNWQIHLPSANFIHGGLPSSGTLELRYHSCSIGAPCAAVGLHILRGTDNDVNQNRGLESSCRDWRLSSTANVIPRSKSYPLKKEITILCRPHVGAIQLFPRDADTLCLPSI